MFLNLMNFITYKIWLIVIISEHPNRILIIGGSWSGKPNALLNSINNQPDMDKTYSDAKVSVFI